MKNAVVELEEDAKPCSSPPILTGRPFFAFVSALFRWLYSAGAALRIKRYVKVLIEIASK
jgi:hypothetical protein